MTLRAVLLGLAGAAAVCGLTYFNDFVLRQTFVVGNFMPISVYGGLLLFLLVVNPLLLWSSKRLALKGRELAVIVALTLAACYVPGRGLGHYFSTFLMLPHHYVRTEPGWREQGVIEMAPRRMLAGVGPLLREEHILDLPGLCSKLAAGHVSAPGPTRYGTIRPPEPDNRARRIWELLSPGTRATVREVVRASPGDESRRLAIVEALNAILGARGFYRERDYEGIELTDEAKKLLARRRHAPDSQSGAPTRPESDRRGRVASGSTSVATRRGLSELEVRRLNRLLLEAAWPNELSSGGTGPPLFRVADVLDWKLFCSKLVTEGRAGPLASGSAGDRQKAGRPGPPGALWELMSPKARGAVEETPAAEDAAAGRRTRIVAGLNELIKMPGLYREEDFAALDLPKEGAELLARARLSGRPDRARPRRVATLVEPDATRPRRVATLVEPDATRPTDTASAAPAGEGELLSTEDLRRLNRHLLDSSYPHEILSLGGAMDSCVNAFVLGLREGDEHIGFGQIPWHAWVRALAFWIPLLLAISFAMIGLACVVHRQWSHHEQLPYPLVTFAHSLLPAEGEARGSVFRNRLFWIGAGAVLFIHLNNYACVWWPDYLVAIPRRFDFSAIGNLFPTFARGHGGWGLMRPIIFFTGIGFAYLLTTDVSLSVGLAPFVYALVTGIFLGYGVPFWGRVFELAIGRFICAGAYFGFLLVLLYTGRRYFLSVLRRCVGLGSADEVERHAVWGARVFLVGATMFTLMLFLEGLELHLAALYTLGAVMLFVVLSRIVAETGLFFVNVPFSPCIVLWGFLGAKAIGPRACLMMFMVSSLLLIDPRETLMPFVVQGLKLVDKSKVRLGRTATWGALAVAIGMAVALTVTLYIQHDYGVMAVSDDWTAGRPWRRGIPRNPFDTIVKIKHRLAAQGNLEDAGKHSGGAWFRSISSNVPCLVAFGVTMGLVLLFTACRLRFPRWPFHPVMFLVLSSWSSQMLAASFLLGWLIKSMALRFGGARGCEKLKPLMFGLIAGDMLGGIIPMIIGAIHYAVTRTPPPGGFRVMPG